jgi:hypothetical protein
VKVLAALLALTSLAGLAALPCVCVPEEAAAGHGCCAPRESIRAAEDCCPPQAEQPRVAAASPSFTALPAAIAVFLDDDRTSPPPAPSLPRRMACAPTPVLRI